MGDLVCVLAYVVGLALMGAGLLLIMFAVSGDVDGES